MENRIKSNKETSSFKNFHAKYTKSDFLKTDR